MKFSNEAKLQAILDNTGAGTWEFNMDFGELSINDRCAQMLGYELSELEPISIELWERLSHPVDFESARSKVMDVISHKTKAYDCIVRMRHKDGSWRFIHSRGSQFKGKDARWLVGMHLDITEQRQIQHQLTKLAESLPGVIYSFVIKPDGSAELPYISAKAQEFFGVDPQAAMNDPELTFAGIHPDDVERVRETMARSYEALCEWSCDYRVEVEGVFSWIRGVALPERDDDGVVTWHGMLTNIDRQKHLEAKLEKLAITDELTNAFNRRHMLSQLEAYLAEHARYKSPFSLVSIDIDHFKAVNDNYGHLIGDAVLRTFANLVSDRIRKTDVFARAGGEEFLLLMPRTAASDAAKLTESIRHALEHYQFEAPDGKGFTITISAGVVECSDQAISGVAELLHACDQSLYSAKDAGRNQLVVKII